MSETGRGVPQTIVVATRNEGKLREFQSLLRPFLGAGCAILSLGDLAIDAAVEESGGTFAENARLKAVGYSRLTPHPVLADDSGLEVEALGGRPGIHSARYAGPDASDGDRIRKLLGELDGAGVADIWSAGQARARFVCALALTQGGEATLQAEGDCHGVIIRDPRGSNGFGYDPVFLLPDLGKTFAELDDAEKNLYSHRARAVGALVRLFGAARPAQP
ncbi:MAG: RdgB/HAM1 family non-canonical purine NTP pyrophosphatase [Acidobacteriota bacterium]|jgi:XTP/dITP diphosphohydrolase|nr:RdgB/HAM1 family non-canonical purine NTP pyrophosphatase [Acidobacteriota bacterium]